MANGPNNAAERPDDTAKVARRLVKSYLEVQRDGLDETAHTPIPFGPGQEEVEIVTITPMIATDWWEKFGQKLRNRSRSAETISAYARDMLAGRWPFNGEGIKFDVDGYLLDGQHRLLALMVAGAEKPGLSFRILVVRGLPRETQKTMDQGRPRRLPDILALDEIENTNKLAGAASALLEIKVTTENIPTLGISAFRSRRRKTNGELRELIERHPLLAESIPLVEKARGLSPNLLAAIHYVGKHLLNEGDRADAFIKVFTTGMHTYPGDPAHTLREFLLRHSKKSTQLRPHVRYFNALRAWNAFRRGDVRMKWNTPRQGAVSIDKLDTDLI